MLHLNNKKMTLRKIHEQLVEGKPCEYFAEFFGVDQDTFKSALRIKSGNQYRVYKQLLKNNERRSPKADVDTESIEKTIPFQQQDINCEEGEVAEMINERKCSIEEALASKAEKAKTERDIASRVCEEIDAQITEKRKKMKEIQDDVNAYLETLKYLRDTYNSLEVEVTTLEQSYEKGWEEFESKSDAYQQALEELEAYRTVEIYFDENGLQVSKDGFIPKKEQLVAKQHELFDDEEYGSCPARVIKVVAAIIVTISLVNAEGKKYAIALEKCTKEVQEWLCACDVVPLKN